MNIEKPQKQQLTELLQLLKNKILLFFMLVLQLKTKWQKKFGII